MTSEPDFTFTKKSQDDHTTLLLQGIINERTDLQNMVKDLEGARITINLKNITRINSCGVRDWVNATKPLAQKFSIEYVECSRAIVDQLNMIVNFLNSGKIVSFYAPYYCDECDKEMEMLINIDEHFPEPDDREEPESPDFECPHCKKTMEFNEDEDRYFLFLHE